MRLTPEDIATLQKFMDAFPMPPMPEGYEDWVYRDIPLVPKEDWEKLFGIAGQGNYKLLAMTVRTRKDGGVFHRGQVWLSPQAIENFKAWTQAKKEKTNE